jgi:hypothetical protein
LSEYKTAVKHLLLRAAEEKATAVKHLLLRAAEEKAPKMRAECRILSRNRISLRTIRLQMGHCLSELILFEIFFLFFHSNTVFRSKETATE